MTNKKKQIKDFYYFIGYGLNKMRILKGFNLQELSKQTGYSPAYLSEIESGVKSPKIEIIKKYATALDMEVSSFILFAEHMEEEYNYSGGNTNELQHIKQYLL